MFAAPPEIVATTKWRLPDEFRDPVPDNAWRQRQRGGQDTHSFLEGPSFDRDGALYVVDISKGRIFRISTDGKFDCVADYDGEPNGLKVHADGRIFVADHKHGLKLLDPVSGEVSTVLDRPRLERFKGLNDLVFSSSGDLYFTDQGQTGLHDPSGRVWRLCANGRLDLLLDNVPSPNGIVLSPDEATLYVAVTRANAIWRVPLLDGGIGRVGLFIQLSGSLGGPDGIAVCQDGGLVVCHIGMGSIWSFDALGEPRLRIRCPEGRMPSNLAFGGARNETLFITEVETGVILTAAHPVAGQPMFSHH